MDKDYSNLTIKKDSGRLGFFLFGLYQTGCGLFILYILILSAVRGDFFKQNVWLNLFITLMLIYSIPAGLFALTYAFGERKIFEIDAIGIKNTKQNIINWNTIYEIETRKYNGPRMMFYRIRIFRDYDRKNKTSIWFTSDIETDWTEIIDSLSYYTARNNIAMT